MTPATKRAAPEILDAPFAVATDGSVLLNVSQLRVGGDAQHMLDLARSLGRPIFVGVKLTQEEVEQSLVQLDNAAAEIAARTVVE